MSESRIHFTISFCEPQAHYVEIEMDISGFPSGNLDLKMPVWTPGSYLIREFARHIECLTAESDNNLLQTVKQNKNTWRVVNHEGSAKISYRVYGFEASVRTNFIKDRKSTRLNSSHVKISYAV